MNSELTYSLPAQERNALILAGGKSSRMNYPKAWLPFNGKESILEHLVDLYHDIDCKQVVVVLNNAFVEGFSELIKKIEEKAIIVRNHTPGKGRIYSLQLGINAMKRSGMTFIQNVDNPLVNRSTLESLLTTQPNGYARPVHDTSGGHPILVTNGVLENINLSEEDVVLRDLLSEHRRYDVSVNDETVLYNINTPEDYRQHFGMEVPALKPNQRAS